jgi:hypothetical protein
MSDPIKANPNTLYKEILKGREVGYQSKMFFVGNTTASLILTSLVYIYTTLASSAD